MARAFTSLFTHYVRHSQKRKRPLRTDNYPQKGKGKSSEGQDGVFYHGIAQPTFSQHGGVSTEDAWVPTESARNKGQGEETARRWPKQIPTKGEGV